MEGGGRGLSAAASRRKNVAGSGSLPRLSPRELQCLTWCSHGKTNWEIGRILGISDRTVEHHISSALRRLECTTRIQGVATALRLGLMP